MIAITWRYPDTYEFVPLGAPLDIASPARGQITLPSPGVVIVKRQFGPNSWSRTTITVKDGIWTEFEERASRTTSGQEIYRPHARSVLTRVGSAVWSPPSVVPDTL
jgi:hypothetical protein